MRRTIAVALLLLVADVARSQAPCKLEGVWQLVSGKTDGKSYASSSREMKIIAKGHFAFVSEEDRGVKELRTVADTLQAYRTMASGGGTYAVQGTTYTEKLDYFSDPTYVGRSIVFSCRVEGDRFYQTGLFPVFEQGKKVRDTKLEEVWRRVE